MSAASTLKRAAFPSMLASCTWASSARPAGGRAVSTTTVVRVRCRSSAKVPDSAARPFRMIVTRSHSASTSDRMWLESRTVRPWCRTSRTTSWNTVSISGSRPEVGSSSRYSSTSEANAATRATFWRFPLE